MKAVQRRRDQGGNPATNAQSEMVKRMPTGPSQATAVEIRGTTIHFPFLPYKCQEQYMEKVLDALNNSENALLESPTGTGKTLCLLCSTLAWQRDQGRILLQATQETPITAGPVSKTSHAGLKVPTIIYASRTHSQLSQVVRELRNTRYRPKHAVIGSRQQMCVNPKVKTATAVAEDINHECNRLGKERRCRFRNNLEGFRPPSNEQGATYDTQPVLDMEDLIYMGETSNVCPFYYTRSLLEDAELILVPYNYLFDKDARESTMAEVVWENSIVIFDEAHNLESFASESASFDLSSVDVGGCITECTKAANYVQSQPELKDRINLDNVIRLKALFLNFEEYILQQIRSDRNVFSGDFMMEIFQEGASINHANHAIFVSEASKVSDLLMDMRSGNSKGPTKLEFFVACVKRVFGETSEGRCLAKSRAYRVHISSKPHGNSGSGRVISYWCFAPSLAMQELENLNIRSIIVTSGTLSPLQSYSMELGLNFKEQLENPHIISDNQIHVRVMGQGVSGKNLSSSYERRSDSEYITELGNTLVALARIVPCGMLVFFPSYSVMEVCVEGWGGPASTRKNYDKSKDAKNKFFAARQSKVVNNAQFSFPYAPNFNASTSSSNNLTPWKRLLCQKSIILEPKSTTELPEAISDFHRYLNLPKSTGCVLMGVCRGKISEGIDFSHDMCRAVIITGLPFAPYMDPKVKLKREYLDGIRAGQSVKASSDGGFGGDAKDSITANSLSGAEWYSQQAHRAVNQAIGRVIRNKLDYGAVILLDSRFGDARNTNGLSLWVRTRVQHDEGFGKAIGGLVKFYKEATNTVEQRENLTKGKAGMHGAIVLAYDDGPLFTTVTKPREFEASVTKITVVESAGGGDSNNSNEIQASNDNNNTDEVLNSGYVPSSRVLASYDLKDMTGRESTPTFLQNKDQSLKVPLSHGGLGALYLAKAPSATRNLGPKKNGSGSSKSWDSIPLVPQKVSEKLLNWTKNAAPLSLQLVPPQATAAQAFFELAKQTMSPNDLGSIRKAIVEMKSHGDRKDIRSYLRSATDVITLIMQQTNFQTSQGFSEPGMLSLFFSLLPTTYREDAQKIAIKKQLGMSFFGQDSDSFISDINERRELISQVRLLLNSTYCNSGDSFSAMAKSIFIEKCKPIVYSLLGAKVDSTVESASTKQLLDYFRWLLPSRLHAPLHGIIQEVNAAKFKKRIKASDKARTGESVVETARFLPPASKKLRQGDMNDEMSEDMENRRLLEAGLLRAQEIQRQKRENVETAKQTLLKEQVKLERKDLLVESVANSDSRGPQDDLILNSLKVASTDRFVKKVGPLPLKCVSYNAPTGLICLVCERVIKKVRWFSFLTTGNIVGRMFTHTCLPNENHPFPNSNPNSPLWQSVGIWHARTAGRSGFQNRQHVQNAERLL